ncbi:hypothetical protein [Streptomyces zaomyceticus]|uniref:hypothetical protein n=1 Tax=Streptomyces zaomyceticus TaxID=68286 RepID=UPI00378741CC
MAHDIPITDRQRSLARHDISNLANAAGQWLEVETCDAMVTAVLNALATDNTSEQPAAHFCGNCDGIDPASCLMNPDPAVQQHLEQLRTECAAQLAEAEEDKL